MYVAGNGGIKTEVAHFLAKLKTAAEVLEYTRRLLQLYREEGWYLERTVHYVSRVGLDYVKKRILDDARRPQGAVGAAAVRARRRARSVVRRSSTGRRWTRASLKTHARLAAIDIAQCRRIESTTMSEWKDICLRRRHSGARLAPCGPRSEGIDVAVFRNDQDQVFALARPLPAQGRAAVPGHRVRHQRGLPAAQLDHRAGRRLRQGAGRRLHPAFSCKVMETGGASWTPPSWPPMALDLRARSPARRGSACRAPWAEGFRVQARSA